MSEILYEAIFQRKSIRKYEMKPLEMETLFEIEKQLRTLKSLQENISFEVNIVLEEKMRGLTTFRSPYYLCFYSEKKDGYLENAGYILQQMDLYFSSIGIGSCWLGMAKPPKEMMKTERGLNFVIMLAFGAASEPLYRQSPDEFKRKSLVVITDIADGEKILEPVRLAPSGINNQPWFFSGTSREILISRKVQSLIKKPIYDRLNKVDMGIALYHLYLSATHLGKTMQLDFTPASVPKGFIFVAKARLY